uniref:Uncharacterized protein n=1 Tax=Rhizophora mucronata TaxID=61149 RepID=A0A2P2PRQ0_RHIMU
MLLINQQYTFLTRVSQAGHRSKVELTNQVGLSLPSLVCHEG